MKEQQGTKIFVVLDMEFYFQGDAVAGWQAVAGYIESGLRGQGIVGEMTVDTEGALIRIKSGFRENKKGSGK